MSEILGALVVIVVLLFYIAIKIEAIERQWRRERTSTVDEEMKELNPKGFSN